MKEQIKNPFEYGYLGDEKIEISANEFNLIRTALDHGIAATQKIDYVEITAYRDSETGKAVANPKEEDVASGKVRLITDKEATFHPSNAKVVYDGQKLKPEMLYASEMILDIHIRNVEAGIAKSKEQLIKANELTQVDTNDKTN